jgi:folate-binding protein YgfZ
MDFSSSEAVFPYLPAAWLRIFGPDAVDFLQGQFTQDIRRLAVRESIYGLWLDRKGKIIADSSVVRGTNENEYWLASLASPASVLRQRLESHLIADDVTIEDATGEWSALALLGPGWGDWFAREPHPGFCFRGRRGVEEAWEWLFPNDHAQGARDSTSFARSMTEADMQRLRIRAGIAAVPADLGPTDLPNEGGLDKEAISFTKGCYLGQEVMARLKAMGRIRRRLVRVAGPGVPPALPAALWQGEKKVGELRSAVEEEPPGGFVGLALLTLANLQEGKALGRVPGGSAAIEVNTSADFLKKL